MRTISRLLGNRAYLCGPIDRCPVDGRVWREQLRPSLLQRGIVPFDPLDKPIDGVPEDPESRAERREQKATGDYDAIRTHMKRVVDVDLRLVNTCDFLIALVDMDIFACGTLEEIFRANDQKKPVLLWCPQGKFHVPDWLYGRLPHALFFDTLDQIVAYLDTVAFADETPETHNRWMFFDFAKIYPTEVVSQIKLAASGVN